MMKIETARAEAGVIGISSKRPIVLAAAKPAASLMARAKSEEMFKKVVSGESSKSSTSA